MIAICRITAGTLISNELEDLAKSTDLEFLETAPAFVGAPVRRT